MSTPSDRTEALATRIAAVQRLTVDAAIRDALETQARAVGAATQSAPRRRMDVEQMSALGAEIAAMPLLDPRSPAEAIERLPAAPHRAMLAG